MVNLSFIVSQSNHSIRIYIFKKYRHSKIACSTVTQENSKSQVTCEI